jgi:hypothetical protein
MARLAPIGGLTLLVVATAACIPIAADGAFRAQGDILSSASCELQLFASNGGAEPIERVKVAGAFQETFVVAPYRSTYRLDLLCNGAVQRSLAVDYGGTVTYEKPVQFGKVALTGRGDR